MILWTSVEIWWYFVPRIFVNRNLLPGLLWWSSLQTKEGQRPTKFLLVGFGNSQTPSTTTVWPSDHREDYRSCAWPFYSLVRTFPKALHSDWQGGGDYMTGLVQTSEATWSWSLSPCLLVGTPSAIIPELAFSRVEHSRPYSDCAKYIFDIYYLLTMLFVYWFLLPLRLVWLLVCCLYKEVYLQIFKCVSFWLHGCCGEWEGGPVNQVNHTSWVAVVTPTDRPKSVRNCC